MLDRQQYLARQSVERQAGKLIWPELLKQFLGIVDNAPDEQTAIARAIVEYDVPLQ